MVKNEHILTALPLVASVLGNKYGVRVEIGGEGAYTDGSRIHLPALPSEADETFLHLVRGLIDHESGHIRETDFDALRAANLSPLEKHIWNSIEDYYVEQKMAAVFPGCKANLLWLTRHLFIEDGGCVGNIAENDPALILNWILYSIRAWDVPEVGAKRDEAAQAIEGHYPGLVDRLDAFMSTIPGNCGSTADCLAFAGGIVDILKNYLASAETGEAGQSTHPANQDLAEPAATPDNSASDASGPESPIDSLRKLITVADESELPKDLGRVLIDAVQQGCSAQLERTTVAVETKKDLQPLSSEDIMESRKTTVALRTRLQGLLQDVVTRRNRIGSRGRLHTRSLYRIAVGSPKVFRRSSQHPGLDTSVHILVDSSGSMAGKSLWLAGLACFALASSLHSIPGIDVAVTAFPGSLADAAPGKGRHRTTVAPILECGQRPHNLFCLKAEGSTPMAEALWWALLKMAAQRHNRKLVLVITDGEPDNVESTSLVIGKLGQLGFETYAIGISTASVMQLFPGKSHVIHQINDLAPAMFELLGKALAGG